MRDVDWIAWAAGLAVFAFGLAWAVWDLRIRPLFIPATEIDRLADDLIARHPNNPARAAFNAEAEAWRRSDSFEIGRRRRVSRAVRRKLRRSCA
jgi:hypothetical protein